MTPKNEPCKLAYPAGDARPDAEIDAQLASAQNWVQSAHDTYRRSLEHRAAAIHLSHAAGWPPARIAKKLGLPRRTIDAVLTRDMPRSPEEFLDQIVDRNGGLENPGVKNLRKALKAE